MFRIILFLAVWVWAIGGTAYLGPSVTLWPRFRNGAKVQHTVVDLLAGHGAVESPASP